MIFKDSKSLFLAYHHIKMLTFWGASDYLKGNRDVDECQRREGDEFDPWPKPRHKLTR